MAAPRAAARLAQATRAAAARPQLVVAPAAARVVCGSSPRSFSSASIRSQAIPTGKESPFVEPAGVNPADASAPFSAQLQEYGAWIMASLPKYVQQTSVYKDELTVYVAPSAIEPTMLFLRDHTNCQYKQVMDICGADYPTRSKRFEVVYHLLSVRHNHRLRVKTYADETSPVPSICHIYRGADWYEREAWDMYGILFSGHPDLRRILTDYGFEGHPLRKDFPLTGYTEVRYDEEKKRVVSEPLQLSQEFRNFEGATSPWEGTGTGIDARAPQFVLQPPKEDEADKAKQDQATKK